MSSVLALLSLELDVVQSSSLKDKRRAIKGFKDRIAHRFNVSVAEVAHQDNHRLAELAVAMVGSDRTYVEGALQRIVNQAAGHRDMLLLSSRVEWL